MRTLQKTHLSAAMLALCCAAVGAQRPASDPLQSAVQTPASWRSFNWTTARMTPLWTDKRWIVAIPNAEKPDDATHIRNLDVIGLSWSARLRKQTNPTEVLRLSMSADVPGSKCGNYVEQFGKTLGEFIFSDESLATYFSDTNFHKLVLQKYQWTVGTTRIDVLCIGNQGSPSIAPPNAAEDSFVFNLTFSPADGTPPLQPSFMLRCTRKASILIGQPDERAYSDLVIRVEPGSKRIKNPQFSQISVDGTVNIDDMSISFTVSTGKADIKHSIDRITGSMNAELLEGEKSMARLSGTCERVNSSRKF